MCRSFTCSSEAESEQTLLQLKTREPAIEASLVRRALVKIVGQLGAVDARLPHVVLIGLEVRLGAVDRCRRERGGPAQQRLGTRRHVLDVLRDGRRTAIRLAAVQRGAAPRE
eukprot:6203439-Prymnesium_polylepis.2